MRFTLAYLKTIVRVANNEKPMNDDEFLRWAVKWVNPDHLRCDPDVYRVLLFMYNNDVSGDWK